MTTVQYDNGKYTAEIIIRQGREEFITTNKNYFPTYPEAKRAIKLGELWDACNAVVNPEPNKTEPVTKKAAVKKKQSEEVAEP